MVGEKSEMTSNWGGGRETEKKEVVEAQGREGEIREQMRECEIHVQRAKVRERERVNGLRSID